MSLFPRISGRGAVQRQLLQFGGLNRSDDVREGELTECENVSTRRWPYLAPRQGEFQDIEYAGSTDMFRDGDRLFSVSGAGTLYLQEGSGLPRAIGTLTPGAKQWAVVNTKLVIWPDKAVVDLRSMTLEPMNAEAELHGVALTDHSIGTFSSSVVRNSQSAGGVTDAAGDYNLFLYTYGTDRAAVEACWHDGAWDLTALAALASKGGMYSDLLVDYRIGDSTMDVIFIPGRDGMAVTGSARRTRDPEDPQAYDDTVQYPNPAQYNALGQYAVITGIRSREYVHDEGADTTTAAFDYTYTVYQVNASGNPVLSETFHQGDILNITGTLYGFGDGEDLQVLSVDEETVTVAEGSFTVPMATAELENDIPDGTRLDIAYGAQTWRTETDGALYAGQVLYLLPEDLTHVYVWQPEIRATVQTLEADLPSSAATELTAEEYSADTATLERIVPPIDYICASENRLWGVANRVQNRAWDPETRTISTFYSRIIYASALGEPAVFALFAGLSTDSWQTADGTEGDFTAICPYGGRVLCWKEDKLVEVTGYTPDTYATGTATIPGVQAGAHRTIVNIAERLYYLGPEDVYVYAGAEPRRIGGKLGTTPYSGGVGWTDGKRYYLNTRNTQAETMETLSYDTVRGLWMRSMATYPEVRAAVSGEAPEVLYWDGRYTSRREKGKAVDEGNSSGYLSAVPWSATLAVLDEDLPPERKRLLRLIIRYKLGPLTIGAGEQYLRISAIYGGQERTVRTIQTGSGGEVEGTVIIPIAPHRQDKVLLRIQGAGDGAIMSITREYTVGSVYGGIMP